MQANRLRASLLVGLLIWAASSVSGCANIKTIVVPVGEPFILINPIPGPVKALVQTLNGEWVEGSVQEIPAGWACWYPDKEDFK